MDNRSYRGSCFCGSVEITVTGEPVAMGFCHCNSCRLWGAAPVNAFTLWNPGHVKVTKGAGNVGTFSKHPRSHRKFCKVCGGHLMTDHPSWNVTDVYAAIIPDLPFRAGLHVNYQDHVVAMKDGLPKQKDMPKEMGGSGVLLPEE